MKIKSLIERIILQEMKLLKEAQFHPDAVNFVKTVEDINQPGTYKVEELLPFHFQVKIEKSGNEFDVLAMDKSSSSRFDYINFRQSGMNANIPSFKTFNGAKRALLKWRDRLIQ